MIGVGVRVGQQRASEDYFETQTSSSAVRSTRNGGAAWIMTQYLTGLGPQAAVCDRPLSGVCQPARKADQLPASNIDQGRTAI